MRKIYLEDRLLEDESTEIKCGFLNINGLLDGNHADYLNEDKNLINLDILVLGETKLESNIESSLIQTKLDKWDIIGRFDAEDKLKHMGLILLSPKETNCRNKIRKTSYIYPHPEMKIFRFKESL